MKHIAILGVENSHKQSIIDDVSEYFTAIDQQISIEGEIFDLVVYLKWLIKFRGTGNEKVLNAHKLIVLESSMDALDWDHVFYVPSNDMAIEQMYVTHLVDWGLGSSVVQLLGGRDNAADTVRAVVEGEQ